MISIEDKVQLLIAKHSFPTVEYLSSLDNSFLLKYPMGCSSPSSPFWVSTAPTPLSEASVCKMKGLVKSGVCKIGLEHKSSFNLVNAQSHSFVYSGINLL